VYRRICELGKSVVRPIGSNEAETRKAKVLFRTHEKKLKARGTRGSMVVIEPERRVFGTLVGGRLGFHPCKKKPPRSQHLGREGGLSLRAKRGASGQRTRTPKERDLKRETHPAAGARLSKDRRPTF